MSFWPPTAAAAAAAAAAGDAAVSTLSSSSDRSRAVAIVALVVLALTLLPPGGDAFVLRSSNAERPAADGGQLRRPQQRHQQQRWLPQRAADVVSIASNWSIEERVLRIEEIKNRLRASFGAMLLPPSAAAAAARAAADVSEESRRRIRAELRLREALAESDANGGGARSRGTPSSAEDIASLDLYSFRQLKGDESRYGGVPNHFEFAVDIPHSDERGRRNRVESAILHLYKERVRPAQLNDSLNVAANVAVSVYQLLADGLRRLIGARVVSLAERGWIALDVTEAVQSWLDDPLSNRGLLVDAAPPHNLSALMDFATGSGGGEASSESSAAGDRAPLLDIRVYQQQPQRDQRRLPRSSAGGGRTRARRDAAIGSQLVAAAQPPKRASAGGSSARRGGGRTLQAASERCAPGQCCRKKLTVSFADDLGWTWVVEPKTFDAYYCEGGCVGEYRAANNFAEVKKALRRDSSPGLRNRCTPTRYRPLTVVHVDAYGEYVMTEKRDMIVDECGCA